MAETAEEDGGGGGGTIGDWRPLISSPRGGGGSSLFSGFLADGYPSSRSFSQILNGSDLANSSLDCIKLEDFARKGDEGGGGNEGIGLDSNWKPPPGRNGGTSIAERRAARCGFNAPRLNTARFRTISPLSSPSGRSPYLTIPPGLSPTSLLDSPVMLSNSQAQPSPTTGTFPFPSQSLEIAMPSLATSNVEKDKNDSVDSSFMFKPHRDPISFQYHPSTENQSVDMPDAGHHSPAPVQAQVDIECQAGLLKQTMTKNYATGSPSTVEGATSMVVDSNYLPIRASDTGAASEQAPQSEEQVHVDNTGSQQLVEGDQRGAYPPTVTGRPAEDGYNWRKYGQKQVKGSEYPRSYYKCTHQNCQVKKKIERSHDGQITEIIYKGGHNHPMPQPSRRSALGSTYALSEMLETGEDAGSYVKVEGGSAWRSIPQGSRDNKATSDWRGDGFERTSSTSVVTEVSDPLSTAQGKQLGIVESADTPELSSTLASHDEEEDRATQGSISLGDDADDDESESKRRRKDSCLIETSMASRAVREPRVVVQTDSEVDILDDGYRWRKYGQKVVKGNPNPRSYYKCTSAGCSVRKHVERASHDTKYVITTYEGKHNHEVPAARNSSHMNSNSGNVANTQSSLTLPRSTNIPKPETHVHDLVPRFERKPDFSNEFIRSTNIGAFATDMKFGPSSCYDMKLPPFQTSMPCGSFGLSATHNGTHQASHIAQVLPDFQMSLPMNVPLSANLALTGFGCNNLGKVVGSQSFISGQQTKDGEMRFLRPKQEQKDDVVFQSHLPGNNLPNASSSVYRQMMGGYPL
ncbi:Wrky transcription factor protein [Thalictrum thalictroides]|uniref:Wrky transcription factor protein n=1 Tax=Thalictrum thalictroides TaxID=46969 RepID=A0A7J6WTB4_THATH|nr:Wrky transcription factor protein [Thalictrum thalictroides]